MAIARLLLSKPALHLSSRELVLSTRRWCSSPSSTSVGRNDVLKSEASSNKDTAHKRGSLSSIGGILANLKQKIVGSMYFMEKNPVPDSGSTVSAKSVVSANEYSSGDTADATTSEVVRLLKNSEQTKHGSLTKIESSQTETASQSVPRCVTGTGTPHETEKTISLKADGLDSTSDSSELANTKVVELVSAEKLGLHEERSPENHSLTNNVPNGTSGGRTSLGERQEQSHPEKGKTHKRKLPLIKIIEAGRNLKTDLKSKPLMVSEALDSSSGKFTGEFRSDAGLSGDRDGLFGMKMFDSLKLQSNSKANDKLKLSNSLKKVNKLDCLLKMKNHAQMIEGLAFKESKRTDLLESCRSKNVTFAGSEKEDKNVITNMLQCIKHIPFDKASGTERMKPLLGADFLNSKAERDECASKGDSVSKVSTSPRGSKEVKEANKSSHAFSAVKHSRKTVLVRFLPSSIEKRYIGEAFNSCGEVSSVQDAAAVEGCVYKDAFVTFETEAAAQMALKKTDLQVKNRNVVVEATSPEDAVETMPIPDVIGDPDVPVALVKEPTRTVKIQPLTHDISSNQVKEALRFCGSNICRYVLGSSSSAAFVEFETEEAKERALVEHTIRVSGKKLFVSRIDVPRTTVLRFSNLSKSKDLRATCMRYGEVKKTFNRKHDVADVYFKLAEWPNMHNILNSLNGTEMEGKKLMVSPAPVLPPEILRILMKETQGKRYIKEVIEGMLRKLVEPREVSQICNQVTQIL